MKAIREVLERYVYSDKYIGYKKVDQAEAEIKKIVLDMVGEDKPIVQNDDGFDNGFDSGYNYHGAEIRKKVEGEL